MTTDQIVNEFPFFLRLRSLIAARPNLLPVGLGNNDTGFDVSLLMRTRDDDDTSSAPEDTRDLPDQLIDEDEDAGADPGADVAGSGSDSDIEAVPTLAGSKRKAGGQPKVKLAPAKKSRGPQPATSVPAAPAAALLKKPTNAKEIFASTVKAEEETAQQALAVKSDRNKYHSDITLARIKMQSEGKASRAEAKRQDRAAKMDLLRLKMEQEHEYKMAQLQRPSQAGSSSFSGSFSDRSGSQFPSDSYHDRDYGLPRLPRADKSPGPTSYDGFGGFSGGGY